MSDLKVFLSKVVIGLLVLLAAGLCPSFTDARPISSWTPERTLKEADILVVAEVLEVTQEERIAKEKTRWRIPLLRMSAKISVKRSFAISGEHGIHEGEAVPIEYYAIDQENCKGITNGPQFPNLSPGDVFVFPLKKTQTQEADSWELIDEEDFCLLTPAVIDRPRREGEARTGIAFLRSELAGAFSRGRYETVFKAAKYLGHLHDWGKQFEETYKLVAEQVGDDQDRWLSIAVACYCAMGMPRSKVADLLKSGEHQRLQAALVAKALGHIDGNGLDDRIIALSMKQRNLHTWGTAVTIAGNYARHPTAIRLLTEALKDATPEAVYIAQYIIKDGTHPLSQVATDAAVKVLMQPGRSDFSSLRPACQLIRDYGDEDAFALLLDQIRKSQKLNLKRYTMLWQSCAYVKSQRLLPICDILINDQRQFTDNLRFCDLAVGTVQSLSGKDFGYRSKQTEVERNRAIEKARAYLERHRNITNQ